MLPFIVFALLLPFPCSSPFLFFRIGLIGFSTNWMCGARSWSFLKLTHPAWLTLNISHASSVVVGWSVSLRVIPGLSYAYVMFSPHYCSKALLWLTMMALPATVFCKSYRLIVSWKSYASYCTKKQTLCTHTTGHGLNTPWAALRTLMLLMWPKVHQSPRHQDRAEDSAVLSDPGLPSNF